jgi:hypothetical protein
MDSVRRAEDEVVFMMRAAIVVHPKQLVKTSHQLKFVGDNWEETLVLVQCLLSPTHPDARSS